MCLLFIKDFRTFDLQKRALAHLGYVVARLDISLKQFQREGGKILIPPIDDPLQKVKVCLLKMDDRVDIELVSPLDPDDHPVKARLRRGGGLDHICYWVDNLEIALSEEQQQGSIVICPPIHAVAFNREIAFVHRRSGLLVEFIEI
jgi:methylmalonyl-CoA/ethylmalonyl-CoA epimerase